MRLDELGHLFGRGLPVDSQVAGAELLGHPRADHVDPEDPAGGAVGEFFGHDLHHALGLADDPGPAVASEGVLLDHHLEARLLGLRLRQPGEGHLGVTVDGPRLALMTTIAAANATWASCGVPATMSPPAQTFSALVRM